MPFGRPKCAISTGLPPAARMSRTVGTIRSIRVASVTLPSSTGTLMSTRVSTTLPFRSMSSSVFQAIGAPRQTGIQTSDSTFSATASAVIPKCG